MLFECGLTTVLFWYAKKSLIDRLGGSSSQRDAFSILYFHFEDMGPKEKENRNKKFFYFFSKEA